MFAANKVKGPVKHWRSRPRACKQRPAIYIWAQAVLLGNLHRGVTLQAIDEAHVLEHLQAVTHKQRPCIRLQRELPRRRRRFTESSHPACATIPSEACLSHQHTYNVSMLMAIRHLCDFQLGTILLSTGAVWPRNVWQFASSVYRAELVPWIILIRSLSTHHITRHLFSSVGKELTTI